MSNLLIERGGRTEGPFTPAEVRRYLARNSVAPHTPAWTDGLLDWAPLEQVLPRADSQQAEGSPEFTDTAGRNIVPDEVRGFSWGAFLCGPLWGFPYRVWASILAWLPGIGALVWLWMGFNGRELAWRARDWESPQAFLQSERRWTRIGLVLFWLMALIPVGMALWAYTHRGGAAGLAGAAGAGQPELPAAPADPEAPARPQGAPTPTEAKPATPAPQAAGSLRSRAVWRKQLMGMAADRVTALMGAPAHTQKVPDKNVDVWIYRRVSFERSAADPDAFMLIGMQGGAVAGIEFVKKDQP